MCGFHCHEADIGEQRTQTVRYIIINCNKKNGNLEGTEIENNEEKGAILDMVDPDKRYWEDISLEAEAVNYGRFPLDRIPFPLFVQHSQSPSLFLIYMGS